MKLVILLSIILVLALTAVIIYGGYQGVRAIMKAKAKWEVFEKHTSKMHLIGLKKFDEEIVTHRLYMSDPDYEDAVIMAEVEAIDTMQTWNNSRKRLNR